MWITSSLNTKRYVTCSCCTWRGSVSGTPQRIYNCRPIILQLSHRPIRLHQSCCVVHDQWHGSSIAVEYSARGFTQSHHQTRGKLKVFTTVRCILWWCRAWGECWQGKVWREAVRRRYHEPNQGVYQYRISVLMISMLVSPSSLFYLLQIELSVPAVCGSFQIAYGMISFDWLCLYLTVFTFYIQVGPVDFVDELELFWKNQYN